MPIRNTPVRYLEDCLTSVEPSLHGVPVGWAASSVIVVDDVSDETLAAQYRTVCRRHGVSYLRLSRWLGIGGARWAGVARLATFGVTHVVFLDADDELLPLGMRKLLSVVRDDAVVVAPYQVAGRYAEPYVVDAEAVVDLLRQVGPRAISPLLHMNVVGHGAVVPIAPLGSADFPIRRYSGEFVTLWGRTILSGRLKVVRVDGPASYRYFVRSAGNYLRDVARHRRGVGDAFAALRSEYLGESLEYRFVAAGGRLPSLYAPFVDGGWRLPSWCAVVGSRWMLTGVR